MSHYFCLFTHWCSIFTAPFIEEPVLSPRNFFCFFVKIVWLYLCRPKQRDTKFYLCLMLMPSYLDYCSFIVSLEVREHEFSNLVLKYFVSYSRTLYFHVNFKISFFFSYQWNNLLRFWFGLYWIHRSKWEERICWCWAFWHINTSPFIQIIFDLFFPSLLCSFLIIWPVLVLLDLHMNISFLLCYCRG